MKEEAIRCGCGSMMRAKSTRCGECGHERPYPTLPVSDRSGTFSVLKQFESSPLFRIGDLTIAKDHVVWRGERVEDSTGVLAALQNAMHGAAHPEVARLRDELKLAEQCKDGALDAQADAERRLYDAQADRDCARALAAQFGRERAATIAERDLVLERAEKERNKARDALDTLHKMREVETGALGDEYDRARAFALHVGARHVRPLHAQPGDVLVVETPEGTTAEQMRALAEQWNAVVGAECAGVKLAVLCASLSVGLAKSGDPIARAELDAAQAAYNDVFHLSEPSAFDGRSLRPKPNPAIQEQYGEGDGL